jgi:hypothetical protein
MRRLGVLLCAMLALAACKDSSGGSTTNFFGPVTISGCSVLILPGGATVGAGDPRVGDLGGGQVAFGGSTFTIAPDCSLRPVAVVPPVA